MGIENQKVRFVTTLPFWIVKALKIMAAEESTTSNSVLERLIKAEKEKREVK